MKSPKQDGGSTMQSSRTSGGRIPPVIWLWRSSTESPQRRFTTSHVRTGCNERTARLPPNPQRKDNEFARSVERNNARRDMRTVLAPHRRSADAPTLPASEFKETIWQLTIRRYRTKT